MPSYDVATRAQALTLKAVGFTNAQIEEITGIQPRTLQQLQKKALERGYNPTSDRRILDCYVEDGKRSGRPTVQTASKIDEVLTKVRRDRYGREKSCAQIALDVGGVSDRTVWQILRSAGFRKTKPTRKPGLTDEMKQVRLRFALQHQHWTMDDWKRVIWSDETAIVCGFRRGGYRIWRTPEERFTKSCIRPRWKGYSEFMFWGCYSWHMKGPCHIWKTETKAERTQNDTLLAGINEELEPILRSEWELNIPFRRLALRNLPGRTPEWRWNKRNGKLTRQSSGGIDWFRYCRWVVVPKIIPFARELSEICPEVLVQEDGASPHKSAYKTRLYSMYQIDTLIWPGNSPDLNMIEQAWPHLKRVTTKKGAPQTRADAERAWLAAWEELEQWRIQAWIERIPRHIQEIIRLNGGNEYREGAVEKARVFHTIQPEWEDVS